jgi:hypothetical protein
MTGLNGQDLIEQAVQHTAQNGDPVSPLSTLTTPRPNTTVYRRA